MRKIRKRGWLSICLCAAVCLSVLSVSGEARAKVKISAESGIVMDVQSGTILYSKNMDKREYPASITKVMTALVAIENSSLSETVTFSYDAVMNLEAGASNIGTKVGEKMSMEESLYAILLMSANEVCNGVAEHIAGSTDKFVKMMNDRAKELGCTGTHFANTNGLWKKNHYTTAHDIELTELLREDYENYHFEEEIREGDILFPYQIRKGRTSSRNAIKLLELMGYDESIVRKAQERARRFMEDGVWRP